MQQLSAQMVVLGTVCILSSWLAHTDFTRCATLCLEEPDAKDSSNKQVSHISYISFENTAL